MINLKKQSKHEKIQEALISFSRNEEAYYYEFLMMVSFHEAEDDDEIPTAAVCADKRGLHLIWNRKFIDELDIPQIRFLLMHEVAHLLSKHTIRTAAKNFDHLKANITQDMIINDLIIAEYTNKNYIKEPTETLCRIPKEYNLKWVFEQLYSWLQERADKADKEEGEGNGDGEGDQEGNGGGEGDQEGDGKGMSSDDLINKIFSNKKGKRAARKVLIDEHIDSEESEKWMGTHADTIQNALKARGVNEGNLVKKITELFKTRTDYLKEIKKQYQMLKGLGNPRSTYTKPNKKSTYSVTFKGHKKEKTEINVVLDTSGSMWSDNVIEKILNVVFQDNVEMNLQMIDTTIKPLVKLRTKKDLMKIDVRGGGGTELQPAINFFVEEKKHLPMVILTDGYTDTLNFSDYKNKCLVICSDQECPISSSNTGNVRQIIVDINNL